MTWLKEILIQFVISEVERVTFELLKILVDAAKNNQLDALIVTFSPTQKAVAEIIIKLIRQLLAEVSEEDLRKISTNIV